MKLLLRTLILVICCVSAPFGSCSVVLRHVQTPRVWSLNGFKDRNKVPPEPRERLSPRSDTRWQLLIIVVLLLTSAGDDGDGDDEEDRDGSSSVSGLFLFAGR